MSTIITKRQFPGYHKYEMELAGRPLTMEVGKMAELANAAALVRLLMAEHSIPLANIKQHHDWNGKNCPATIRATSCSPAVTMAAAAACSAQNPMEQALSIHTPV